MSTSPSGADTSGAVRGAALLHRILLAAVLVAGLGLSMAGPAAAKSPRRSALPQSLWVLELDGKGSVGRATLQAYRAQGFNALLTRSRRLSARRYASVRRGAAGARLLLLWSRTTTPARCAALRRQDGRCVLSAATPAAAIQLARSPAVDLVVVHLRDLGDLRGLRNRARGRILALVRLDGKRYDAQAWADAVAAAEADPRLDLGVSASGSRRGLAANRFGEVMRERRKPRRDLLPPTPPLGLGAGLVSKTSVTLAWSPASDDVGVAGYGLYQNGTLVGATTLLAATVSGLGCGKSYALAVDAYDAAGNRSTKTSLTVATSSCALPGDTQPPSVPQGLRIAGTSQTTVTMAWNASSDNVGVAGYRLWRGSSVVATTQLLQYTYTGLSCGSTYSLSVEAYDAAGNYSYRPEAVALAPTSACSGSPPPPPPASASASASASATAATAASAASAAPSAASAATAAASASAPPPPPPGSATVFMSPSGSDANPCTQAQPCRSFGRAYRVATAGTVVEIAAGSYSGETVNPDASKTSTNDVIFRPASGAQVTFTGSLHVHASHFEFRDLTVSQVEFYREADDITFRNVVTRGLWMWGPSSISFLGGEITCGFCAYHPILANGGSDSAPPRNILFDAVYFHDWHSVSGEHTECLQIGGGDGLTIRNSVFKNCGTGNGGLGTTGSMFIGFFGFGGPVTRNVLVENNFLYPSGNPYAIQMSDLANLDLRYNSISQPIIIFDRDGPGTGMDMIGNIMGYSGCSAEGSGVPINWRFNVMQGGTCGSTDRNAAAGFIDRNSNLHLSAGAPAINAGDSASYPSRDIDGHSRPLGGAPDAGADEAG